MDTRAFLLSIVIAILIGASPILEKLSLRGTTPVTVLTLRTLIMSALLFLYCVLTGQVRALIEVSPKTWGFIAVPAVFALTWILMYFSVLQNGLVSRVVPIISAGPLIATLISVVFLGEPFSLRRLLGALLIVIGVVLVK